jgi:tripartite-type tricarboxylate transporter receptor subunit TctC
MRAVLPVAMFIAAAASASPALADNVADLYAGKQMKIIVRTAAGSGFDLYSRLLARHMVKHIPGNPTMLTINMPGGGGITSANYVAEVAPKDGTILTMQNSGVILDQALKIHDSLKADFSRFNWIGNMNSASQLVATWKTSATRTFADAMTRETLIGTTGAGAIGVQLANIANNVIGTKFKLITGYSDMNEINLAMERGEIDGRATSPYSSYAASTPYIRDKSINFIIQFGMKADPHVPDVPLARKLGKTPEDTAILDFVSASVSVGWPIATTPDVPKARVTALRKAFDAMLTDPDFAKEAKQQNIEINSLSGAELEEIVNSVLNAPEDIRKKAKAAMQTKKGT